MPLTPKGTEIKNNMENEYGAKKGKEIFYASKNAGKIKGVDCKVPQPMGNFEQMLNGTK